VKLQKNLDKNKFGLVKKLLTNKSVLLSNKKVLLVDKKVWSGGEKTELCPTPPSPYATTFHIHNTS
jgi:hypothetical protein